MKIFPIMFQTRRETENNTVKYINKWVQCISNKPAQCIINNWVQGIINKWVQCRINKWVQCIFEVPFRQGLWWLHTQQHFGAWNECKLSIESLNVKERNYVSTNRDRVIWLKKIKFPKRKRSRHESDRKDR